MLLQLPDNIKHLNPSELYKLYDEPEAIPITRLDGAPLCEGVPPQAVIPIWLGKESEEVKIGEAKILLVDFGESYLPSAEVRRYSNSPLSYRPPEGHFPNFSEPFSFAADIWSLGCLIWEVLGQRPLFESWFATEDQVLDDQVDLLGKLPPQWWLQWKARSQYWVEDSDGIKLAPTRAADHRRWDWESRLEFCVQKGRREKSMELISNDEKKDFLAMMKLMMVFEPGQRATAEDILQSGWVQRWALPDLDKVHIG